MFYEIYNFYNADLVHTYVCNVGVGVSIKQLNPPGKPDTANEFGFIGGVHQSSQLEGGSLYQLSDQGSALPNVHYYRISNVVCPCPGAVMISQFGKVGEMIPVRFEPGIAGMNYPGQEALRTTGRIEAFFHVTRTK